MKAQGLFWKAPTEQARPRWLEGCADVVQCGVYWWVGSPLIHPQFDRCEWIPTAQGWAVAAPVDKIEMIPYLRPRNWWAALTVEDARGREWIVPAILAPDGVPAVAKVRRRVNGEWVREYVDESQEVATEAALAVRNEVPMTLDEQSDACLAILETAYFIDADTIAALGFLDDVLAVHALKHAAGLGDYHGSEG
jgi:hypothetical protein